MKLKLIALTAIILLSSGLATANIEFDHSEDIIFQTPTQFNDNVDLNNNIQGFPTQACPSGEAVTDINDDGSVQCNSITSTSTGSQNLSQVLENGNVANQTINMDGNSITNTGEITGDGNLTFDANNENINAVFNTEGNKDSTVYLAEDNNPMTDAGIFRYDGDKNQVDIATLDSGNFNKGLVIPRFEDEINAYRELQVMNGNSIQIRDSQAGNPVLDYNLQEGDDYGAFVRYDSNYSGDTNDNRLVIGTENSGNDYEVLSAERAGSWAKIHRDTNISGDLYVDGELTGVSTGGSASGLSEVLEQNNVANQSIAFSNGIEIGESTTESPNTDDIAIGNSAGAVGSSSNPSIAIGSGVEAFSAARVSIGGNTDAPGSGGTGGTEIGIDSVAGTDASAFGSSAVSSGQSSVSLGALSEASAEGSVAIGEYANAPNSYEATFGNLNGEELDLNVTGNATIHGEGGLDMPNGIVIGEEASVNQNDASEGIAIGSFSVADSGGSTGQGTAVGIGSSATNTYATALGSSSSASDYSGLAVGFSSQASGDSASAIGRDTDAGGDYSSAIGWRSEASGQSSTAIGPDSDNSGTGASAGGKGSVAIGADSVSNSDYTARFGSDSQPYDVDVTGDLNVDGELTGVSTGGGASGLSEVLEVNNTANQSINLGNNDLNEVGNVELRQPQSGNPVMSYRMQEGDDYGAYLEYDSQFEGDTNDNRLVIGTEDGGTEYEVLTAERSGSSAKLHRDTDVSGNLNVSGVVQMPNGIAVGSGAEATSNKGAAVGYEAANGNTQDSISAIGYRAGKNNDGNELVALGFNAGWYNSGSDATGLGTRALQNNSGNNVVGVGHSAGVDNQFDETVNLGADSSTSAEGAMALGSQSLSDQDYTARFGSDSQPYDVDVTGNLSVDGQIDEKNVRDVSYSSGHTAWSSGLSTEEVNRFGTTSTESVEIERLDVQVKGGGSNSNFEVEVYDAGSSTVLGSTTAGTPINDVGKGSEGSDVTVRVTNSDGSDVTASITVSGQVVE